MCLQLVVELLVCVSLVSESSMLSVISSCRVLVASTVVQEVQGQVDMMELRECATVDRVSV